MRFATSLTALAVLPGIFAAPTTLGHRTDSTSSASSRADAVKQTFQIAWNGYQKYAFPNDELHPVSNSFSNSRNGWGASAADAITTAIVMDLPDIVNVILNYIPTINWGVSYQNEAVSLFETTIRYMAGMLSAYDLLNGPCSGMANNTGNVAQLLQQAQNLANNLSYAFDTPTGIPSNNLILANRSNDGSTTNSIATIGTLVLEWTRLSDLTGNTKYGQLAQKAESYLLNPQPSWAQPWPGLVGTNVDIASGQFADASGGWNGGDDSFYEYLIKMYVYDSSRFGTYKDRWVAAADSTINYLASHPSSRPDLTWLAAFNNQTTNENSGHLACFDGGNFILGGLVLKKQQYVDFGLSLVSGCEDTYTQTLTGIGPEGFGWNSSTIPSGQEAFYQKAGFYITSSQYILRPEVIESFYYAYRATGDTKYQDWAWNAFLAINSTTHVGSGYSEISNVNAANGGSFLDFQDSFFFAEVLKYSYLIQAADAVYQVNHRGANQFVFNTEAHPFKVAGTPI
ncbi:glycoside hydrolase family 47 protein [Baudoinia panamericana UAMH 10762]|uniref:alpha-1,2-Mannosidase n=1 Tax=Baudoinia panamericana (strain UAMH 10762) TaxID=717646 RepID=M2N1C6_BAUPA|nr:glycoside hydrolase family 47 protein [Baudoinia panamericana UAMH 10762]EMC92739.1 glycoside hydrolase family 47 protein [Baudoinia panamericana UAMH 10762]